MAEGEPVDPWKLTAEDLMQLYGMSRSMAEQTLYELRHGAIPDVIELPETDENK